MSSEEDLSSSELEQLSSSSEGDKPNPQEEYEFLAQDEAGPRDTVVASKFLELYIRSVSAGINSVPFLFSSLCPQKISHKSSLKT